MERQLRDKLRSTWTLVLEYMGGFLLYSLKEKEMAHKEKGTPP